MMLALSVLAVALLTGIAWALRFRARPVLDEASARSEAEGRLAGFHAAEVQLADGDRGAVLRGRDGSLALLLPLGDSWISRRLPPGTRVSHIDGHIAVKLGEPMLAEGRLPLERLPAWLQEEAA